MNQTEDNSIRVYPQGCMRRETAENFYFISEARMDYADDIPM